MAGGNLPIAGKYRFTQPFSLTNCAEHAGSTGIINPCVRNQTISFAVGDVINSYGGGWDDFAQAMYVGFVMNGQNMPIPASKVVKVADTTPDHISNNSGSNAALTFSKIPTGLKIIGALAGVALIIVAVKAFK